jgi:hypothetical protein
MTTLNILIAARALIGDPANWGQGNGDRPGTNCASEAISKSAFHAGEAFFAFDALMKAAGISDNIPRWNDHSTHAQVLAGFDKAIAAERAKQKPTDISVFHKLISRDLVSA